VVVNERSGFLVPPRDSAALSEAMGRLAALPPERRRAMGQRGQEHIERHYGLERVAERWEEIYRDVLARKGAPASAGRHGIERTARPADLPEA